MPSARVLGQSLPQPAQALAQGLASASYLADDETALALYLAVTLGRPILVEGPPGVGKTDLARAASSALARPLLRLQCYEGLDARAAIYEWDYAKQMLFSQLLREAVGARIAGAQSIAEAAERIDSDAFFSEKFLVARPLLAAIRSDVPVVLLIDEVDRADPEFEAVLLETLAEEQVTIPEIGTFKAKHSPLCILTTNASREITDALRRRCIHVFLDYPPPSREAAILKAKIPNIEETLAQSLVDFAARLRAMDLRKPPSIAETVDWARAVLILGKNTLGPEVAEKTLSVLLKHADDRARALETMAKDAKGR